MFRLLRSIGFLLFLPGLAALGYSLWNGPAAWFTDERTFWGTPISLFVFWIGLAHAGTLLSAVFLALGVHLDRRTALLAEMSTLVCLAIACIFPLMHLGILENFYMVVPFADGRGNFANLRSPLVWDFCCIAVYGILSLLYFGTHLLERNESLKAIHKPMAWLLFPLVLWVHTIVSLDFANTFVPEWRGAFFPLYFIVGAIFSGIALVNLLLTVENYRVQLLEKLMMAGSLFMVLFWVWNFVLKGEWSISVFVFAALLPQLMWVEGVRESRNGRALICLSILLGLLLERIYLVSPDIIDIQGRLNFGLVDLGLLSLGLGIFLLFFFGLRKQFSKLLENDEILMGDVSPKNSSEESVDEKQYFTPFTTPEYKMLRFPVLCGFLVATLYGVWAFDQSGLTSVDLAFANYFPMVGPIIAFVAGLILCGRPILKIHRVSSFVCAGVIVVAAALFGFFYGGGKSEPSGQEISMEVLSDEGRSEQGIGLLWNARCAACHGNDGRFNEKFVREFYPMPQKLDLARVDSIGEDSLVQVILKGRTNMSAYGNRISDEDARGLVKYMRHLAEVNERGKLNDSSKLSEPRESKEVEK